MQGFPSLHGFALLPYRQPSSESHVSVVQTLPSLQLGGVPARQPLVGSQVSAPLQNCPSPQTALSGVWVHVSAASSQASTVHAIPSLQFGGVPEGKASATPQGESGQGSGVGTSLAIYTRLRGLATTVTHFSWCGRSFRSGHRSGELRRFWSSNSTKLFASYRVTFRVPETLRRLGKAR